MRQVGDVDAMPLQRMSRRDYNRKNIFESIFDRLLTRADNVRNSLTVKATPVRNGGCHPIEAHTVAGRGGFFR